MNSLECINSQLSVVKKKKKLYKSLNWKEEFILKNCLIQGLVLLDLSMGYITKDQLQTRLEITTHWKKKH